MPTPPAAGAGETWSVYLLTYAGQLVEVADFTEDALSGARERASALGRALRTASDPEVRSAAARYLAEAGRSTRYAKSIIFRTLGPAADIASLGFDFLENRAHGDPAFEAAVKAALSAGGSIGGAALGIAACGTETVATSGLGSVACPALVAGGGLAGGFVGEKAGDLVFWLVDVWGQAE